MDLNNKKIKIHTGLAGARAYLRYSPKQLMNYLTNLLQYTYNLSTASRLGGGEGTSIIMLQFFMSYESKQTLKTQSKIFLLIQLDK